MALSMKYAKLALVSAVLVVGSMLLACDALRMINLDVPQMAIQGDTIQLSCSYRLDDGSEVVTPAPHHNSAAVNSRYDLEVGLQQTADSSRPATTGRVSAADRLTPPQLATADEATFSLADGATHQHQQQRELLYAIKWYKDEREFFRYVSQDWPHKQALPMDSLNIDVDKSDNQTVVLRNVSLRTSGAFRCEVSTEAPSFLTKSIERKVLIYSLPTEGPTIESAGRIARQAHHLGDSQPLELTCVSRESKPRAQLDWILNERVNLTARALLRASGQPAAAAAAGATTFRVANERLVRLHAHQATPPPGDPAVGTNLDTRTGGGLSTYALEPIAEGASQVLAKSVEASARAQQTIALSVDSLDQLPEIAMSRLNLSLNAELFRFLAEATASSGGGGEQSRRAADSNWRTRKAFAGHPLAARGGAESASRGAAHGPPPSQQTLARPNLRIRCVARVLHLKMSDDIKLMVANRARPSTGVAALEAQNATTAIKSQRREMSRAANSAVNINSSLGWSLSLVVALTVVITEPGGRHLHIAWNVF